MRSLKKNKGRSRGLFYYSLLLLFTLTATVFSQQNFTEKIVIPENEKANYINGITSGNPGLKSSCIYFAGRYRLSGAGEMLVEELKKSDEEKLSLLIAWSLYRIGNEWCMDELKKIAEKHSSDKLRKFCYNLNQLNKYELALESSNQE